MLPEPVGRDACRLAEWWGISFELAVDLVAMDTWAEKELRGGLVRWPGLYIISGFRTHSQQSRLNPDAPNSLHTLCPAEAADLMVGQLRDIQSVDLWALLGGWWKWNGDRWGGDFRWEGSPLPNPKEANHFDRGLATFSDRISRPPIAVPLSGVL